MTNVTNGGFDIYFDLTPSAATALVISTNITARSSFSESNDVLEEIYIYISKDVGVGDQSGKQYIYTRTKLGSTFVNNQKYLIGNDSTIVYKIRVFLYDYYISVYCNGMWVYSYVFADINYPSPVTISLGRSGGDTLVVENIKRTELKDRREAIFVDYESNTESAIQSIIQQRPIEITHSSNRELEFTYSATRDAVDAVYVKSIAESTGDNSQLSSDGIVYSADVGISIDEETAKSVGIVTRMYRLSELDSGALEAAAIYQKRARQRRKMFTVNARFDPRLETRDIYNVNLFSTGTQRHIIESIIVEDVQVKLENGLYRMSVTGRNNE